VEEGKGNQRGQNFREGKKKTTFKGRRIFERRKNPKQEGEKGKQNREQKEWDENKGRRFEKKIRRKKKSRIERRKNHRLLSA